MIEMFALTTAALVVRAAGGVVRGDEHHAIVRLSGWTLCAIGGWLLAGAAGAWFPVWPALLVGVGAGLLHAAVRRDQPIKVSTDGGVVVMCGVLSIPPLGVEVLIGAVALAVVAGLILDQLPKALSHNMRLAAFAAPVVVGLAGAVAMDRMAAGGEAGAWYRSSSLAALNVATTGGLRAERIELPTGAVAWLDRPRETVDSEPRPGAILFHGNHRSGSRQPAACVLRRALLDAGYVVLSLDHPGYGATPLPNHLTNVESWDLSPHVAAALERLRAQPNVSSITAIGHSMGCLDVLRALAIDAAALDAAIVFGMGVYDPPPSDERWMRGFLTSRNLPREAIDVETAAAVRQRYYEMEPLLAAAEPYATPLIFVRFEMEHENLVVGREKARALFRTPPIVWDFDHSTHYFSASERFGIIFGDARVTRDLAHRLRNLRPANLVHLVELDH